MSEEQPQNPPRNAETDERFPSGPWVGFWLQRGMVGRQWMRDVQLNFAEGRVNGWGCDCVGDFTFRGRYELETGRCVLAKQYIGGHIVEYDGRNENDGLWLWGTWAIRGYDRGGFHLWPQGIEDPTQRRLEAEIEIPAEELAEAATG